MIPLSRLLAALVLAALFSAAALAAPAQGLAQTPPMGWNSWNHFARQGRRRRRSAPRPTAMVSTGMRDAGYIYVNIDDTWEGERDAQGIIHPNSKFPDMKALADYRPLQRAEARHLLLARRQDLREV